MLDQSQLDDCRRLALRIAPELGDVYVLDTEQIPKVSRDSECYGFALRDRIFNQNVRDALGDRYTGPAPVIALDGERIRRASPSWRFEAYVRNVLVHEVAHHVPAQEIVEVPATPQFQKWQLNRIAEGWKHPDPEPDAPNDPHDRAFVRRCIHLFVRASSLGLDVEIDTLFGPYLWMGYPANYLAALLAEAMLMIDQPFSEIEAIDPPPEFLKLWRRGLAIHEWMRTGIEPQTEFA